MAAAACPAWQKPPPHQLVASFSTLQTLDALMSKLTADQSRQQHSSQNEASTNAAAQPGGGMAGGRGLGGWPGVKPSCCGTMPRMAAAAAAA